MTERCCDAPKLELSRGWYCDSCGSGGQLSTWAMPVIYIAGKFTAPTREGVERNILAAEEMGLEVAKLGACPLIPHANTSHPDFEKVQPYQFWIAATLRLLCGCDAVLLVPGWEQSSGARGEKVEAERLGLPVFEALADLKAWLAGQEAA